MSEFPTPGSVPQTPASTGAAMSPVQETSPYQTPGSYDPAPVTPGGISPTAIHYLVRTRKWVRLCSVIGFIGSAFMILAAVGMMFTMGIAGSRSAGVGLSVGLVYLVFAILYIYPSVRLWQYASSISRLEASRDSFSLETALDQQRSFWKFVGIVVTITIIVYAFVIVFFVMGAAATQF